MPVRWIELNSHWFVSAGYIPDLLPGFSLGVSCTSYPAEAHRFQELDRKKTLMCWMFSWWGPVRLNSFLVRVSTWVYFRFPSKSWTLQRKHSGTWEQWNLNNLNFPEKSVSLESHIISLLHPLQIWGAFGFLWASPAVHILTNNNFPAHGVQSRVTPRTCHPHFYVQSGYTHMKYSTWHVNDIECLAFW